MNTDYRTDSPEILLDFLSYHETIKAHSQRTVDEYYLDLRNFFRYLKWSRDPALQEQPMDTVDIRDVDLPFVGAVTLSEVYAYMAYLSRDRVLHPNSDRSAKGLSPASRARKLATIRSFYGYLCNKVHKLDHNPVKDIDAPKLKKTLPRYLTLDESISLLESVDGPNRERDLCILTLFLNCGLRISELIGLNLADIHDDALRVLGKGDKVRIVYLNQACQDTLADYLAVRRPITGPDRDALFLSGRNQRISRSMVNTLVKKRLSQAGLDSTQYSSHKLRHTAATLMLQNGVDVKAVQEVLATGVSYDDMMIVQKDDAGRVSLLQANTTLMNSLASETALHAQAALSSLENQFVSIPLGAALGVTILAGSGPRIRVQILPVGAVSALFSTEFQSAGINQTRHKILLTLEATVRLVIPNGVEEVAVSSQMAVAESIIVGLVPDSFVDVNNDSEMLNLIP